MNKLTDNAIDTRAELAEINPDMVLFDDLEEAFLGVCTTFGRDPVALYDYHMCIEIRMRDGAEYEEAVEFHEFNTAGLYAGPCTPAFVTTLDHVAIPRIKSELEQAREDLRDQNMQIECMREEYQRLGDEHLKLREAYKQAQSDFMELKEICERRAKDTSNNSDGHGAHAEAMLRPPPITRNHDCNSPRRSD